MIRGYISLCLPPTLVILLPCCKHDALRNTVRACHHLWSCGWSCQNLLLSSTVHSPVINCTYLFSFLLVFFIFSSFFFLCEKFVIVNSKTHHISLQTLLVSVLHDMHLYILFTPYCPFVILHWHLHAQLCMVQTQADSPGDHQVDE